MMKFALSATLFASSVVAGAYSQPPAEYQQATTSCTLNQGGVYTAPPEHVVQPSYTASAVPNKPAATHKVIVGGDAGLVYTPEFVYAAIGDVIHFEFHKQNHSVTQSTFAKPCVRKEGGVDSGLLPNIDNKESPAPTFEYVVDTTEATWWYCKQRTGTHCGKGMTFAINPTKEKTFDQFKSMAIAQNGTAAATSTGAPSYNTPVVESGTVTLVAGSPTGTDSAPSGVATWVDGNGQGSGGACQCQCFCGVAAYPSGYGVNNYGGMPGALPAPWSTSSSATAAAAVTSAAGGYYKR